MAIIDGLPTASANAEVSRPLYYAYVGSFTTEERNARGDGIHVYRFDGSSASWNEIQHVPGLVNPSFLVCKLDRTALYAVHGDQTYATAFTIDRLTGQLTRLNQADTGGRNVVHQAFDPSGQYMIVANYASGSVAVLPLRSDGSLATYSQLLPLPGDPGPHRIEQTCSHPHQIVFDPTGSLVLIPDKGLDRIFVLKFDPAQGKLQWTDPGFLSSRPGAGPRHLTFNPSGQTVWILNELDSSVLTCRWDPSRAQLSPVQVLPTLPPNFFGASTAASIAVDPSGNYVYASNRGHDSIAVFKVDAATGTLIVVGWECTRGKDPRFICISPDGHLLIAANEQGDTIITFKVNSGTGELTPFGDVLRISSPVTIAFAKAEEA